MKYRHWGNVTSDELRAAYIRLADCLVERDIDALDLLLRATGLSKPLIWWRGRRLAAGDEAVWQHGKSHRRGTVVGFYEELDKVEIASGTGNTTFSLPLDRLIFEEESDEPISDRGLRGDSECAG